MDKKILRKDILEQKNEYKLSEYIRKIKNN